MCKSDGCCHGSVGTGFAAEAISGSAKAAAAVAGIAAAVAAVTAAVSAMVMFVRAVMPFVIAAEALAALGISAAGWLAVRRFGHGGLYKPPPITQVIAQPAPAALPAPERLAIENRHVIPAWQDYEVTEVSR